MSNDPATIAIFTDLHVGPPGGPGGGARRSGVPESLLRRGLERLGGERKPDVVVLLGDLVDDGSGPGAPYLYRRIADAVRSIPVPAIVLPGNHDGPAFFDAFPRPSVADHAGMRFVCLLDPEEPQWNARRNDESLTLMRTSRSGYAGPIVSLQHVPVFPPGRTDCPYGYVNAGEVIRAMRESAIHLALAGHYHRGFDLVGAEGLWYHATRALCEEPFCFDVIRTNGVSVALEHHTLGSGDGAP